MFLAWAHSSLGQYDQAIAVCQRAIEIDPDFGNPFNDVGAYLIEQKEFDQAIPWFERALHARRYSSYTFPSFNLGRVYLAQDQYSRAIECFEKALTIDRQYVLASEAIEAVKKKVH
jgi:Tfp pilus assembly protein PilF